MPYGKIVKSLSGFYEVQTETERYRCRAAGVFRAQGIKPLVGDNVDIDIVDEVSCPKEGSVRKIGPRRNELIRPNVANVDQAMMIFSIRDPEPSFAEKSPGNSCFFKSRSLHGRRQKKNPLDL